MTTTEFLNNVKISGDLEASSTTASTTPTTGSLVCGGGVGIGGDIFTAGKFDTTDSVVIDTTSASAFILKTVNGTTNSKLNVVFGDSTTAGNITAGTADENMVFGPNNCTSLTTGSLNFVFGRGCLNDITTEDRNIAIGGNCLAGATSANNVAIGQAAGTAGGSLTTGGKCVFIGDASGTTLATGDNQISIGRAATCDTANQCTIGDQTLNSIRNEGNGVCDLGESGSQFKDLYLGGNVNVTGRITLSATYDLVSTPNVSSTLTTLALNIENQQGHDTSWTSETSNQITLDYTGFYLINVSSVATTLSAVDYRLVGTQLEYPAATNTIVAHANSNSYSIGGTGRYVNMNITYILNHTNVSNKIQLRGNCVTDPGSASQVNYNVIADQGKMTIVRL